jgi:hypothetical protein
LNKEEFERVQSSFKEKGVKRVPFFIASEKTMHTHFVLSSISRVIKFFTFGYLGLSGYNLVIPKLMYPNLLYLCTCGITFMNGIFSYYMRQMQATFVLRIEWEVESEQFVVVRP